MNDARRVATFLDAQAAELDAARNTLLAYARDLRSFSEWLHDDSLDLISAGQDDVERYIVDLDGEGLSRATGAPNVSPSAYARLSSRIATPTKSAAVSPVEALEEANGASVPGGRQGRLQGAPSRDACDGCQRLAIGRMQLEVAILGGQQVLTA